MKKKITLIFIFLLMIPIFANPLKIKTISAMVTQKLYINKTVKLKKYILIVKKPQNIVVEKVLFPKLNKGEMYTFNYNTNIKTIFYPLLKQKVESKITTKNYVKLFLEILTNSKQIKGKKYLIKYNKKNISSVKVIKENIILKFFDYNIIDGYKIPLLIKVYEGDNKIIQNIKLKNIKIN